MNDRLFWLRIIISILRKLFALPEPPVETATDTVANLKAQAVDILSAPKAKIGAAEFQLLMLLIQLLRDWLLTKEQKTSPETAKLEMPWTPSDIDVVEKIGTIRALIEAVPETE